MAKKLFCINSLSDADFRCSIFSTVRESWNYHLVQNELRSKTWKASFILSSQNIWHLFRYVGSKFVHFMSFYYQKFAWRHLLYNWRLEIRFISSLRTSREIIFEDVHAGCSLQPEHRTSSNSHSHFSIWTLRMAATIWRLHFLFIWLKQEWCRWICLRGNH